MTEEIIDIGDRCCHIVNQTDTPKAVIIKPIGEFERLLLKDECRMISELSDVPFAMVAFEVTEEELQPKGLEGTFIYLKDALVPWVKDNFCEGYGDMVLDPNCGSRRPAPLILGGYSL